MSSREDVEALYVRVIKALHPKEPEAFQALVELERLALRAVEYREENERLRKELVWCMSAAGFPDAAQACRNIIARVSRVLAASPAERPDA